MVYAEWDDHDPETLRASRASLRVSLVLATGALCAYSLSSVQVAQDAAASLVSSLQIRSAFFQECPRDDVAAPAPVPSCHSNNGPLWREAPGRPR